MERSHSVTEDTMFETIEPPYDPSDDFVDPKLPVDMWAVMIDDEDTHFEMIPPPFRPDEHPRYAF